MPDHCPHCTAGNACGVEHTEACPECAATSPRGRPAEQRFNYFVAIDDASGCWLWQGKRSPSGYGGFRDGDRHWRAHRWAYEHYVGPIPSGLQLDHLCRNRACVNPDHLEPVTARVNVLRSEGLAAHNARKTHCPQGHPYSGENLSITKRGFRSCRACNRERVARNRAAARRNESGVTQ